MSVRRYYRGRNGLIAVMGPGLDFAAIKEWRAKTGGSLEAYFQSRQLCPVCQALGVVMVGWSDPQTPRDFEAVKELGMQQVPVYEVCSACDGSGRLP